jgi:methylated-DNA-protein-cysteine methyltransferase related protein
MTGRRQRAHAVEVPPFEQVWRLVKRIPRGKVTTYGALSQAIGRRLTPVGIGWAIRAAKEGSIPWHRVVNARGGISTDGEHPGLQRAMLEAEGVRFSLSQTKRDQSREREEVIDLERHLWRPSRRTENVR